LVLANIDLVITEGSVVNSQFRKINKQIEVESAHIGVPDHGIEDFKIRGNRFEILYICNHRKAKGFWDVLASIKPTVADNSNIMFNFVGEVRLSEVEKKQVDNFIKNNSLENNVRFHGIKTGPEKIRLFREASIQILPSYSEGLPTSIIEGLAFGLPIITTPVGVIPEIIKHGINGYLIEPGDREELGKWILRLSRDSELVNRIGTTNRQYFLDEFQVQRFCQRLEQRILSVLPTV
jgi:glycosyltransferase involved in cell wall biosynthesis